MRAGARVLLALVAVAVGMIAVPPPAHAEEVVTCIAKGTLSEGRVPPFYGFWVITVDGNCATDGGAVPLQGNGFSGMVPMTTPACTPVAAPVPSVVMFIQLGDEHLQQRWTIPTGHTSMPFMIENEATQVIGGGVIASRLFAQCPGDPAARFAFSFVRS